MAFPTIIVQGGAFPVLADCNILQLVTNRAANEGYDVLVSVTYRPALPVKTRVTLSYRILVLACVANGF